MADLQLAERYLYPGERWFGRGKLQIRTLLGSCVAITLWHPGLKVGGMCHYLLPEEPVRSRSRPPDARYADDAMNLFLRDIKRVNTCPVDYRVGLFGGGNMFTALERAWTVDIGRRNTEMGRSLLRRFGFVLAYEDVGGKLHRQVILDLMDGKILLRRGHGSSIVLAG